MVIVILGALNFGLFVVGTFIVGGDAVNGDISCPHTAGKYYLRDNQRTDRCHEVSRQMYWYSKVHCLSVFISAPLVIAASLYTWHCRRENED